MVLVGRPGEKYHSEDLVIDGMMIIKWILKMWDRGSHGLD
jgi:hypothetical protein